MGTSFWENYTWFNWKENKEKQLQEINASGGNRGSALHGLKGYYAQNVISFDLSSFWKRYSKLERNTNLKYSDLLGSYHWHYCEEQTIAGIKTIAPVYEKVMDNGKTAYLFRSKFGSPWRVSTYLHKIHDNKFSSFKTRTPF